MRRRDADNPANLRLISRRGLVLAGAQLGVMGVLGWRMRSMQVDQADKYRMLAEENRISVQLLRPSRGLVFDHNGVPLAENAQVYRIIMVREEAGEVEAALSRLRQLVPMTDEDIARAKDEVMSRPPHVRVPIADRVTWEDLSRVAVNAPALPGIYPEVGLNRHYPLGEDMAHVVGYVGPVSAYDMSQGYLSTDDDPLLQIPRFPVGKTGIEARTEHTLRGGAGTLEVEVNAAGRVMRELSRREGLPGEDLQLSVDARLQNFIQQRLVGESASVVVLDVETGDVKAISSAPSFDPNLFVRGISVADWTGLNENKYRPLAAKAIQGTYPPGSTFKMVVALAALEAGEMTPDETVFCPGYLDVSGNRFHCWRRSGHGNVNLHQAITQSCDVYFYDIAQRVGIDRIAEMARRMGLGERHDIPLSAVAQGVIPDRAWKAEARGESWRIGDTVNASIGQGYVLTSPLQLAVMTARLATGRSVTPRLIRSIGGVEQPDGAGDTLGLNENDLRRVRAAMDAVNNNSRGTAYRSRIVADGLAWAGKTGTSQVRRITAEERARGVTRNEDLPWERRDHALYVGYGPVDAPKYAVSVVVEHGGGGSAAAAPIARDVMLQALYEGLPPLDAYPSSERARAREMQNRLNLRDIRGPRTADRA